MEKFLSGGAVLRILSIGTAIFGFGCSGDGTMGGADSDEAGEDAQMSTMEALVAARPELADYVFVPGGRLIHSSCVHELPEGATLSRNARGTPEATLADGKVLSHATCAFPAFASSDLSNVVAFSQKAVKPQPPAWDGWVAFSEATPLTGAFMRPWFDAMLGKWIVPNKPTSTGALVYFFNSLQSDSQIIQPVLQWGSNGMTGASNKWVYASWWVYINSDGSWGAWHTPANNATPGHEMGGFMRGRNCTASGRCDWQITTSDYTSGASQTANFTKDFSVGLGIFNRAEQGVLEAYRVTSCSRLPTNGSIDFYDTTVYQQTTGGVRSDVYPWVTWSESVFNVSPNCGQAVNNFTGGTTITY
jgi:hypothetical protein